MITTDTLNIYQSVQFGLTENGFDVEKSYKFFKSFCKNSDKINKRTEKQIKQMLLKEYNRLYKIAEVGTWI